MMTVFSFGLSGFGAASSLRRRLATRRSASFRSFGIARRGSGRRAASTHRSDAGPVRSSRRRSRDEAAGGSRWLRFRKASKRSRTSRPLGAEPLEGRKVLAASVTNVTATTPDGYYKAGDTIAIEVAFDQLMIVSGTPTLEVRTGSSATRMAEFSGVTGNVLKFTYTVQPGDTSDDLDYSGEDALSPGGGFIKASDGSAATLTLASPATAGSLGRNKNIVVDTTAPTLPTIQKDSYTDPTRPKLSGTATLGTGEKLQILVNGLTYTVTPDSAKNWTLDLGSATPDSGTFSPLGDGSYVARAVVTDRAGNVSSASATLTVDTSAPPTPSVVSLTTNNKRPTITGFATLGSGDTLSVTVKGKTYPDSVITKTPGAAGAPSSWSLDLSSAIPIGESAAISELAEDTSIVVATATDASKNTSSGSGLLTIDITAPTVSGVAFNAATPNGAYKAGKEILIDVVFDQAIVLDRTLGSPRLLLKLDSGSTYATYIANTANVITFKYVVAAGDNAAKLDYVDANALKLFGATIKDAAGNDAAASGGTYVTLPYDPSSPKGDLASAAVRVDTTRPGRPVVNAATTNATPPTVTGSLGAVTLEAGVTLTVVVNGATYSSTDPAAITIMSGTDGGNGSWSLPLATSAPSSGTLGAFKSGQSYTVTATVTDAAGNSTSDGGANQITINTTVPVAPKVNPLFTNTKQGRNPTITGTATLVSGSGQWLDVKIVEANLTYERVPVNDGVWELDLSTATQKGAAAPTATLADRTYNVVATVSDGAGNSASDTTTNELVINNVAPKILAVTSPNDGAYKADAVITIQVVLDKPVTVTGLPTLVLNTNPSRTAIFTGVTTTATGSTLTFTYKVRAGDNTPTGEFLKATSLSGGTATIRDVFGNDLDTATLSQADSLERSNASIVIDTTAPTAPTVDNPGPTKITPPTISGTSGTGRALASGETLTVVVNGATYRNVTVANDGTWTLNLATTDSSDQTALGPFVDGTYSIAAIVTDAAGNATRDTTSGELTILTGIKSIPTADRLLTNNRKPTITGTAALTTEQSLEVKVAGATYDVTPVDGIWELDLSIASPIAGTFPPAGLPDNSYNVIATIKDNAGNKSGDITNGELVVDATAPTIVGIFSTTPDGSYKAGSVIALQVQMNEVVTAVGKPILYVASGPGTTTRPAVFTGTSQNSLGTVLEFAYTVKGPSTTFGTDGDNVTKLEAASLFMGVASVKDAAGNGANLTVPSLTAEGALGKTSSIELDTAAPAAPAVTRLVTGVWPPVISGTIGTPNLMSGESLSVTVKSTTGTAWSATYEVVPVSAGTSPALGTWSLDLANVAPTTGALPGTVADGDVIDVIAEVRDRAGNVRRDGQAGDLTIRTTIPAAPTVNVLRTRSATPTITGTLGTGIQALKSGQWLTIVVGGATYERVMPKTDGTWSLDLNTTATIGTLTLQTGWNDVRATITDGFNSSSDTSLEDLFYDTAAPAVLAVRTTKPDGAYRAGEVIDIEVRFDEDIVLDTQAGAPTLKLNITLPAGTPDRLARFASVAGSVMRFTYTVQAGDTAARLDYKDTSSLALNGAILKDLAGNPATTDPALAQPESAGSISLLSAIELDTTPPVAPAVTRTTVGISTPLVSGTFPAPGLAPSDRFTVTIGTATYERDRITVSPDSGNATAWSVNLAEISPSSGTAPVVKAGDVVDVVATVTDRAGNVAADTTRNEVKFVADGATIESVTVTPKNYKLGDRIEFVVTFTDKVDVAPAASDPKWPSLDFIVDTVAGPKQAAAVYSGGTGTTTLRFRYTVVANDLDTDGIDLLAVQLVLPAGASIQDSTGSDVALTFTPPVTSGVLVDGIVPTIVANGVGMPTGRTYETGDTFRFTVAFSEAVDAGTTGGTPALLVDIGGVVRKATLAGRVAGEGPEILAFEYVVAADDASSTGITVKGISLDGGTIRDKAGNNAILVPFADVTKTTVSVNRVSIDSMGISTGWHKLGDKITFTVDYTDVVDVIPGGSGTGATFPQIRFTLDTTGGSKAAFADYVTGSGSSRLTFRYVVVSGDFDTDGIDLPTSRIELNGARIADVTDRDTSLFYAPPAGAANVLVDTVAPRILAVAVPRNSVYTGGDVLTFKVSFSEDVIVTGGPALTLDINGTQVEAVFSPVASTARVLVFTYTILKTDSTTTGLTVTGLSLVQGTSTDQAGNAAGVTPFASVAAPLTIDNTSPTITIRSSATSLKDGDVATITFTLSEPSVDFGRDDVTWTGGLLDNFAQTNAAGTTYTADFTPSANFTGQGTVRVTAGKFHDGVGNPNLAGALAPSLVIDTVHPTVTSITASPTLVRNGVSSQITIILSEPSTTFTVTDVRISGGLPSGFAGSGTTYTFTFTPTAGLNGQATVTVPPGVFTDAIGNDNTGTATVAITVDNVKPLVRITSDRYVLRAGQSATLTFDLSEASTNFTDRIITVGGGRLSDFAMTFGNPLQYTALFTPLPQSAVAGTVSIAADVFTDAAGNGNVAAALTPSITVDAVQPTVAITAAKTTLKVGESTTITFTLSEDATDFTGTDVVVTGGTLSPLIRVNAKVYTATFTALPNAPTVAVDVPQGSFTDAAGNGNLPGSLAQPISIVSSVVAVTSPNADGIYKTSDQLLVAVMFTENVFVTGSPTLSLNAASNRVATYFRTTGPTIEFLYVVQPGDATPDLEYTSTTALSLNGGAIVNSAGRSAITTLAAPGTVGSLGFGKAIAIDTAAPVITSVSGRLPSTPNGSYNAPDRLRLNVTFSEPVKLTGSPSIRLNSAVSRYATFAFAAPNDPRTLVFDYTVQSGDSASDLDVLSAVVEGTFTIRDAAGNVSAAALPKGTQAGSLAQRSDLVIDTAAPTVLGVFSGLNGAYKAGSSITVSVRFNEVVAVSPEARLGLNVAGRFATYSGGSGTNEIQFTYVVQDGDNVGRLDYASAQSLVDGSITDRAGNLAIRTLAGPGQPGSLGSNSAIAIDTVIPVVTGIAALTSAGTYGPGESIRFAVDFSEPVSLSYGSLVLVLNTIPTRMAYPVVPGDGPGYVLAVPSSRLIFEYQTQIGDSAAQLNVASPTALVLQGGSITDAAGNDANLTLPSAGIGGTTPIVIDAIIQASTAGLGTSPALAPSLATPVTRIALTFNTPVTNVTVQGLKLFYEGRSVSLAGASISGSGTSYVLTLPRSTVSLRGMYRLVVGGPLSGISSRGVVMNTPSKFYWKRV